MPVILPVKGIHPQFGENCFIAPNATVVGDVVLGNDCSIWFNAVCQGRCELRSGSEIRSISRMA